MLVENHRVPRTKREPPLADLAASISGPLASPLPPAPALSRKRRVFLVENHPVTREGFAQLIDRQEDLQVCGHSGTASKALTSIDALKPDLVIADFSPSSSNG